MDIQYLMKQAKKLEKAMSDAKEMLSELSVDADAGGGLVKVQMNGRCEITKLSIDPKALDGSGFTAPGAAAQQAAAATDLSMLEDLIAAAVNAGVEKARAAADAHMAQATGGIKIPGLG